MDVKGLEIIHIQDLPSGVLCSAYEFLDALDVARAMSCCKRMRDAGHSLALWKTLCLRDFCISDGSLRIYGRAAATYTGVLYPTKERTDANKGCPACGNRMWRALGTTHERTRCTCVSVRSRRCLRLATLTENRLVGKFRTPRDCESRQ